VASAASSPGNLLNKRARRHRAHDQRAHRRRDQHRWFPPPRHLASCRGRAVTAIAESAAVRLRSRYAALCRSRRRPARPFRARTPPRNGATVQLPERTCEERIAAIAGPDRTLGAIVAWARPWSILASTILHLGGRLAIGRVAYARPIRGTDELSLHGSPREGRSAPPPRPRTKPARAWSKLASTAGSPARRFGGDRLRRAHAPPPCALPRLEIMTEIYRRGAPSISA
jgi:2-dehydropantoate 2-reductase